MSTEPEPTSCTATGTAMTAPISATGGTRTPVAPARRHGAGLRRQVGAAVTALALALGAASLTACGTSTLSAEGQAGAAGTAVDAHQHDSSTSRGGGDGLDLVASDYAFTADHASVPAGRTTVRLANQGHEAHQVQFARVNAPMDAQRFVEVFHEQGEPAAFKAVTWVGGVNGVEPGSTGTATVALEPGDYLMVCFFPTADGTSHVMKQMVAPLHVTEPVANQALDTTPVRETVVLRDYTITVPKGFRGQGKVAFRNEGSESHEVVLVRLHDGKTLADAAAWQSNKTGPAPFAFAGGIGTIAPGASATATLGLAPGEYIATCFVPGPTGTPHVQLGMLATFSVT